MSSTFLSALLSAMRPKQWAKNVFVMAPIPFILHEGIMGNLSALALVIMSFCFAASSVYLVNDTMDRDKDRLHPKKCFRAIASGRLSVRSAITAAVALTILSLATGFVVNAQVGLAVIAYLVLSHIYTFYLKHHSFVDVAMVGVLFSVRTLAGFLAVSQFPPRWELWVVLAGLLAYVIELGKRKCEVQALGNTATTRKTLTFYSNERIAQLFTISLVLIAIAYLPASYTVSPFFVLSAALVLPGMRRFWQLISAQIEDVHPQSLILADTRLRLIGVMFAAYFVLSTTLLG